ncbi:MAG: glycine zipper 2TM domain-containing protein [Burkholderiales bacterium]
MTTRSTRNTAYRSIAMICSVATLTLLAACTSNPQRSSTVSNSPGVVNNSSNSSGYQTQFGNVTNIENIAAQSRSSGAGAIIGGILGAVVGNQVGSGSGRAVATGVGAVGGAVVGNQVEKRNNNNNDSDVYRVTVRYDNGSTGQFDYQTINDLRVGDRVKVEGNQIYRF